MGYDDLKAMGMDPASFRERLGVETAGGMIGRLGSVMAPFQAKCFEGLDDAWARLVDPTLPAPTVTRGWFERTRGSSKTSDAAAMALWPMLTSPRPLRGYCVAVDADQARLLRDALDRLVRINSSLGKTLRVGRDRMTNLRTGSELHIMSSDAPSSYGINPDFLILDEVSMWPSAAMWESLLSSAGKRPFCAIVCLMNAGLRGSWCWPIREAIRTDPRWLFDAQDGPAPWISPDAIAEQERLLPPATFLRLWRGVWADGSGDAIPPEMIERACTLPGPMRGREFGWRFACGVDLGLRRDFAAAVVVGKHCGGWKRTVAGGEPEYLSPMAKVLADVGDTLFPNDPDPFRPRRSPSVEADWEETRATGKVRLAAVRVWRPERGEIDLSAVESELLALHREFGLASVGIDPWQGAMLRQRLVRAGLRCEDVGFTAGNCNSMAVEAWGAFSENRVELYPHEQLLADLRSATMTEKNHGGLRIEFPRTREGGHGDCGTGFLIAMLGARRLGRSGPPTVNRDLVF